MLSGLTNQEMKGEDLPFEALIFLRKIHEEENHEEISNMFNSSGYYR